MHIPIHTYTHTNIYLYIYMLIHTGFSAVLETIIAFTVASVASEFIKFQQRGYGLYEKSRVGDGPSMYELERYVCVL